MTIIAEIGMILWPFSRSFLGSQSLNKLIMGRYSLYLLMATHVFLASGTYVFAKAAAVGFPNAETLTLARALGAGVILLLLTGWLIPRPRFALKDWLKVLGFGILLVPLL